MQVHVIHEIDCSVERIDPAVVEAFLDAELSDDPMLADSICAMADAMSAELHPRGVYKLFNPAICTLPPKYTEPAIKLVGTLAVLYGSAAYERMSEAEHTAMVVSTVGTDEEIALKGIDAMVDFYHSIGMPASFHELGIDPTDAQIDEMARRCLEASGSALGSAKNSASTT